MENPPGEIYLHRIHIFSNDEREVESEHGAENNLMVGDKLRGVFKLRNLRLELQGSYTRHV